MEDSTLHPIPVENSTTLNISAKNSEEKQVPGVPFTKNDPRINKEGRPPDTPEQKIFKKAMKEFIKDYKQQLAESLPLISPILIAKALGGDIRAIREINDRVMGKPEQQTDITSGGEKLSIQISKEIAEKNDIDTEPKDNSSGQAQV